MDFQIYELSPTRSEDADKMSRVGERTKDQ